MKYNTIYRLTETEKDIYGQHIRTYGIRGKTIGFDDISTDKQKVSEMIQRLNTEQLEECQLMYFIEDELI